MKPNCNLRNVILSILLLSPALAAAQDKAAWKPVEGRLATRWAAEVSPENGRSEYPRPQMVRGRWQNLNGLWEYSIRPREEPTPAEFEGSILVPFAVESSLSGVQRNVGPENRLWYRRTFEVPAEWRSERVLLHFGAVDWRAEVWVNGEAVGLHEGGYDPFSFDITAALKEAGPQEVVVSVWDPTDAGLQPRGKQVRNPRGIWYTPVTGIWQTVWLEPVPKTSIRGLRVTPEFDTASFCVKVEATGVNAGNRVEVRAINAGAHGVKADFVYQPSTAGAAVGDDVVIPLESKFTWSPAAPWLHRLEIVLLAADGTELDKVQTYAGLRKIEVAKAADGFTRLLLNGEPHFQYGPLDQGWWPDGLYTAPTEEAMLYDIEITKALGFNMIRKHVKVEPAAWYHACDRLGLLVWQDLPNGDRHIRAADPDIERGAQSARQYEQELARMIEAFGHFPSIIMWVPFNEGWGQFDTARITDFVRKLDPTRLVNSASGWTDRGTGDVHDIHTYPGPSAPEPELERAGVLGEFGGLGLPLAGHTWQEEKNWGYKSFTSKEDLTAAYLQLVARLRPLIDSHGLSAAVYTQTTDVEIEVNGLLTYDRAVLKIPHETLVQAHATLYGPPRKTVVLAACAAHDAKTVWRYTTEKPGDSWANSEFDVASWKEGAGGFGSEDTPGARIGTPWTSSDIWLRRKLSLPASAVLASPHLLVHHDEDAEVFLNGRLVARLEGYVSDYILVPLPNGIDLGGEREHTLAIHCRQTRGGQFIDCGLVDLVPLDSASASGAAPRE